MQPRRVLPEAIHAAFHNNRLTTTQALRSLVQQVQVAARQRGRPFNSVLELLPQADDEGQEEAAILSPEEVLLRDLVNLAVTIREDGQVNPLTVVDISQGASRQFRIETGEQRYQQVSGGNIRGCLYLAEYVHPGLPIFLTEGDFDALIATQIGSHRVSAMSIGSASNRRTNDDWFGTLLLAPRILVCMDSDDAGVRAAAEIALISSAVRVVQVPNEKDLNAFYLASGKLAAVNWLEFVTQ